MAIGAFGKLTKNPVLKTRAGEGTEQHGDEFDSQTIGTMEDDKFVTFEGNAQESVLGEHYEITSDRLKAAIRVANEMTGRPVRFLRLGDDDPHWLQQTHGIDGKGRITMVAKSFTQDHLKKSHKAKYTYDRAQASADLRAIADANDAGEITLITRRVTQPVNESSDGSGAMSSYAFLEWKHK